MTNPRSARTPVTRTELNKWTSRRSQSEQLAGIFADSTDLVKYAPGVLACSGLLAPYWSNHYQETLLRPHYSCGIALCPACRGRDNRHRQKYVKALPGLLADHP